MTTEDQSIESLPTHRISDDWLAVFCAAVLLVVSFAGVWVASDFGDSTAEATVKSTNPLKPWVAKPAKWTSSPVDSFVIKDETGATSYAPITGILGTFVALGLLLTIGVQYRDGNGNGLQFLKGFAIVFALATLAYALAAQSVVKSYNLEYALWALMVGLIISNTVGTPAFMNPALRTEFFIKTGLVLLGAEVLMSRLMALGLPGVCVAWIVTPIVLISTYIFGQKVLKMESKSLNMVISADMSVCGCPLPLQRRRRAKPGKKS